jgi:uncharacterized cupin superfamily protein
MKKISVASLPVREGSDYPPPFDERCRKRIRLALGDAAGLTDFGVNVVQLAPGTWSSQRHWHTREDEFVWVLEGEIVLVTDDGEEILKAGDCVGFKAGERNAHHLQNRSDRPARVLDIGSRRPSDDVVEYPDIDLQWAEPNYAHKDGRPY